MYLEKQTIDIHKPGDDHNYYHEDAQDFKFMNFLEKDERDYVAEVKSMEDNIKLLMARAFNARLKPDL